MLLQTSIVYSYGAGASNVCVLGLVVGYYFGRIYGRSFGVV